MIKKKKAHTRRAKKIQTFLQVLDEPIISKDLRLTGKPLGDAVTIQTSGFTSSNDVP
jgi:hypothetical protein